MKYERIDDAELNSDNGRGRYGVVVTWGLAGVLCGVAAVLAWGAPWATP